MIAESVLTSAVMSEDATVHKEDSETADAEVKCVVNKIE